MGERWEWVTEIVHGSNEPEYYDTTGVHFGTPAPSETSLCFFDDGRLLAVTRARGHCALLSTSEPPYDQWERYLSRESRCYGSAIARVGEGVIVTGRSFANEGVRATENRFNDKFSDHDQSQLRTGVYSYTRMAIFVCIQSFPAEETPATAVSSPSATTKHLSRTIRPTNTRRAIITVLMFT